MFLLIRGGSWLYNKSNAGELINVSDLKLGEYVSGHIYCCDSYFTEINHTVNLIHTHYTRYYLVPFENENTIIAIEAGEEMFEQLDQLSSGSIKTVKISGEVKNLDYEVKQSLLEIKDKINQVYGSESPNFCLYYIDLQADKIGIHSILCGLCLILIIVLIALTIKFGPSNKFLAKIFLIPLLLALMYIIYCLIVIF